jgi:four helix bundle protein
MTPTDKHPFQLIEILLDAITLVRPVVAKIRRHDRNLADQLKRAASAAPVLAGEGNGHRDGNRHAKLRSARAEVEEARVALRVALRWTYVTCDEVAAVDARFESAARILHRLTS